MLFLMILSIPLAGVCLSLAVICLRRRKAAHAAVFSALSFFSFSLAVAMAVLSYLSLELF